MCGSVANASIYLRIQYHSLLKMVWVLLVHWTSHACLILSCLSLLPSLALGHLIKPRETLLTGVCEGVNGSNYQNYVGYNPGKRYDVINGSLAKWEINNLLSNYYLTRCHPLISFSDVYYFLQLLSRWEYDWYLYSD